MPEETVIRSRLGIVTITALGDRLIVEPRGYVGRRLLLDSLSEAEAFGRAHPEGWWHVTDASGIAVPHPINAIRLRRIRHLPNVRGYFLVTPQRLAWIAARLFWRRIIAADAVVRSMAAVDALVERAG